MAKRKRILVSNNNTAVLKHLSVILIKMGFEVVHINDNFHICHLVSAIKPNLIILDMSVSEADELKTLKDLKADKDTSAIPVVMITGNIQPETANAYSDNGCNGFLEKPINLRSLHDILQQFIYSPEGYIRKHLRVNANCNVKVLNMETTFIMQSETLSEKGIYVKCSDPFPVGSPVSVRLPLFGGDFIQLEGTVIYINASADPEISLSKGMAIEFVGNDDDTMILMSEYVKGMLNTLACEATTLKSV